jgi:hypothetical protein
VSLSFLHISLKLQPTILELIIIIQFWTLQCLAKIAIVATMYVSQFQTTTCILRIRTCVYEVFLVIPY